MCVYPCIVVDFPHLQCARNSLLRDVWEWQEFTEAEGVDWNKASMTWTSDLHPDRWRSEKPGKEKVNTGHTVCSGADKIWCSFIWVHAYFTHESSLWGLELIWFFILYTDFTQICLFLPQCKSYLGGISFPKTTTHYENYYTIWQKYLLVISEMDAPCENLHLLIKHYIVLHHYCFFLLFTFLSCQWTQHFTFILLMLHICPLFLYSTTAIFVLCVFIHSK